MTIEKQNYVFNIPYLWDGAKRKRKIPSSTLAIPDRRFFATVVSDYLIGIMLNQKQKIPTVIRDVIVIVFLLLGGAYFIYIAAHGFLTNQAATIGKDSSWLSRDDYPQFFWISIVFHATAGLFALLNGARMLARILNFVGKEQ